MYTTLTSYHGYVRMYEHNLVTSYLRVNVHMDDLRSWWFIRRSKWLQQLHHCVKINHWPMYRNNAIWFFLLQFFCQLLYMQRFSHSRFFWTHNSYWQSINNKWVQIFNTDNNDCIEKQKLWLNVIWNGWCVQVLR